MGVGKWAVPGLLLVSTTCGTTPGDMCALADVRLDDCAWDEEGGFVFFSVPLDTSTWQDGCQTAFERCAARCVLAASSCQGIQTGMSSTEPNNHEPSFGGCLFACK